ncbi:MAG: PKD domain-containing protein [Candidatus Omnitrophota bacterium]
MTLVIVGKDVNSPNINIITPPQDLITNINPYNIKLNLNDDISGIDASSFNISINDLDQTEFFNVQFFTLSIIALSGSAQGTPTLTEGTNIINASISDIAGNTSSTTGTFTIDTTPPDVPVGLIAKGGDTTVDLSWPANTEDDLYGYNLYRTTISGMDYIKVNTGLITETSYQDTGLTNGTTYYYVITAIDNLGNESGYSEEISAVPQELQITAIANPAEGYAPLPVNFSAEVLGNVVLYEWDFEGDGTYDWSSAASPNNVHTYTQIGTFNATIRVTGNTGAALTDTIVISVKHPLTAQAAATPTQGKAPLKVTFAGSGIDQTGTITKYEWDFTSNGSYDWSSSFSQNAYYTYTQAGTYSATLRLTDNNGYIATDTTAVIIIEPSPPIATASAMPMSGGLPLTVNFTGGGTDSDGSIVLYEWDFEGDGVYDWSSSSTGNISYTYNAAGAYTAILRVTDNDGLTDTDLVSISASLPGSPNVSASAEPNIGKVPLEVIFSATATDPDGDIELYEWDFEGDGVYDWSSTDVSQVAFYDNMENGDTGWSVSGYGLWHRSQHRVYSGTWAWYYGQEGAWNYETGGRNYGYLYSPIIDLTNYASPKLSFWRWYQTEGGQYHWYYDRKDISIRIYGKTGWINLAQISTFPETWIKEEFDLTSYAGELIQIRFYFDTMGPYNNNFEGLYIDDITVTAEGPRVTHTYNTAGHYNAVFRATDDTGLSSTATVPIDVEHNITFLSIAPEVFDPTQGQITSVNITLIGGEIKYSLYVKDKDSNFAKILVNEQPRGDGTYTDTWDGRDESGNIMPDGVYYFVIEYITPEGETHTYDVTTTTGGKQNAIGGSYAQFPAGFAPYKDELCPITYNVPYKGEVTAYIAPFNPSYSGEKIKAVLERVVQGSGTHTIYWDGTNDQGQMADSEGYLVAIWSWDLPTNSVIITGARPEITNVSAEPNYFDPTYHTDEPVGYRPVTSTYTLSTNADVTINIYDSGNVLVKTITQTNVSVGTNTFTWDGKNESGDFVDPGQYKMGIKARDTEGNESTTMYAHIIVFY